MLRRCAICGKVLIKSSGPIGPSCLRKQFPKKYIRKKKFKDQRMSSTDITSQKGAKEDEQR